MNDDRVLFVTPPYHCGVVEVAGRWLPLNLLNLATAARRAGFEPTLFDAMSRFEGLPEIEQAVRDADPAWVAITSITATLPAALTTATAIKRVAPDARVVLGGVHPTFLPEEVLRTSNGAVDYVVVGEGEKTFEALLRASRTDDDPEKIPGLAFLHPDDGRFVRTAPRPLLHDLEEYPADFTIPDWPLYRYFVMPGARLGAVGTSRGCTFGCTFCSQQKFWGQGWRGRSPQAVVDEIEALYRNHGVDVVLIVDEYPTAEADRWEEILDRLIQLELPIHLLLETRAADIVRDERVLPKWRRAGIIHVYVGLEATDQETLDLVDKKLDTETSRRALALLREHGMLSETSFVLGFPHETRESIERTLRQARDYDPDMAHFLFITPWPYADLWNEMVDRVRTRDYSRYNLIEPIVEPFELSLDDLDRAVIRCYRDFYMAKATDFRSYPDELRRRYMTSSMKLIMKSSFLVEKMARLGGLPPEMARKLARRPSVA